MPNIIRDADVSWQKNAHAILLGSSFKNYKEALQYAMQPELDGTADRDLKQKLQAIIDTCDMAPNLYTKQNATDSSVGGNDAINPQWSFGIDDDIIHPLTSTDGIGKSGMGRVYDEMYNRNQQILWLSMGVPHFSGLTSFFVDSIDPELSQLMNDGRASLGAKFSSLLLKTGQLALTMPWLPFSWMQNVLNSMTDTPVTKYYDHRIEMSGYWRMASTLVAQLAVGMGIIENGSSRPSGGVNEGNLRRQYNEAGLPEILKYGPDLYQIVHKRAKRLNPEANHITVDDLMERLKQNSKKETSWLAEALNAAIATAAEASEGGTDFVGFRVERSTDSSESISNSTGQSNIAQTLNGKAAEAMDRVFTGGGGSMMLSAAKALTGDVSNFLHDIAAGIGGTAGINVVSGNGFYDIPEVWQNSTFNKSYNFNVQLRARYGDPVSIFQSIYIPLMLLLAAALPRSIGKNTYTSPYLIRGFCKGMFAVPCGMITDMSIRRGAPEYGWNNNFLPTSVDVSITIKDLSPAFFLSMADRGFGLADVLSRNDSLQEYLTTLSGVGLSDRYFGWKRIQRKWAAWKEIKKKTWLNPMFWGSNFGRTNIGRLVLAATPYDRVTPR